MHVDQESIVDQNLPDHDHVVNEDDGTAIHPSDSPDAASDPSPILAPRPTDSELQLTADNQNECLDEALSEKSDESHDAPEVERTDVESVRGTIVGANQELRRIDEYCHASLQLQDPLEAIEGCLFGVNQKLTSIMGNALADKLQSSADPLTAMSEFRPQIDQYLRVTHEGEKLANLMMRIAQHAGKKPQ